MVADLEGNLLRSCCDFRFGTRKKDTSRKVNRRFSIFQPPANQTLKIPPRLRPSAQEHYQLPEGGSRKPAGKMASDPRSPSSRIFCSRLTP